MTKKNLFLFSSILIFAILTLNVFAVDTLNPKKNSKYVDIFIVNATISMIPPDKSFKFIHKDNIYGFESDKYDTYFKINGSRETIESDGEQLRQSSEILKEAEFIVNDVFLKYYKLRPRYGDQSIIRWLMFVDNPFIKFVGEIAYNKKYDKAISNKIETMFKSIIIEPNPSLVPQNNTAVSADFDIIKSLKFVKKLSIPVAYWTEDGLPITHTKGTKYLAIVAAPVTSMENRDIAIQALKNANTILDINKLNDSVFIEKLEDITFMQKDGIKMLGSLKSDDNKSVMLIFNKEQITSYLIMAVCNKEEQEAFFNNIMQFKDTLSELK